MSAYYIYVPCVHSVLNARRFWPYEPQIRTTGPCRRQRADVREIEPMETLPYPSEVSQPLEADVTRRGWEVAPVIRSMGSQAETSEHPAMSLA